MSSASNNEGSGWTLEIVPSHADQVAVFRGLVREIFVTMIPGTSPADTIQAFKSLQDAGFNPVPHIAARGFASETELRAFCDGMRVHGIRKALVLAGGQSKPFGPYSGGGCCGANQSRGCRAGFTAYPAEICKNLWSYGCQGGFTQARFQFWSSAHIERSKTVCFQCKWDL